MFDGPEIRELEVSSSRWADIIEKSHLQLGGSSRSLESSGAGSVSEMQSSYD